MHPALAESWESPDLLTWTFHLRRGVVFHDGSAVSGADVVYSLNRLLQDRSLAMRSYLLNVIRVREIDSGTVEIRTSRPSPVMLNRLSFVLIVPRGSTAATLSATAVGTGPYALAELRPGLEIHLRRHLRYWGAGPVLGDVAYALGRSPADAVAGLLAGRYQLIQADSRHLEGRVPQATHRVLRHESLYVKYLGFDLARSLTPFSQAAPNPFRSRKVRQAIHVAIDRRRLVDGLATDAVPASQPIPRFVFGFDPGIKVPDPDPKRARSLLRDAGLPRGFEATLHTRRLFRDAALEVKEQLAAIGIRVGVQALPDPEFFDIVQRRGASLWLSRWGCPTGDVGDLMDVYVHSTDTQREFGQGNYGGYSNPELDDRIERSAEIDRAEARRPAVQAIVRSLMEELVLIPLYSDEDVYAVERSLSWQPRSDSYIRAAEIAVLR